MRCLQPVQALTGALMPASAQYLPCLVAAGVADVKPEVFMSLPYLTGCINESLRLYPAVTALGKTNTQDQVHMMLVQVQHRLEPGMKCVCCIG